MVVVFSIASLTQRGRERVCAAPGNVGSGGLRCPCRRRLATPLTMAVAQIGYPVSWLDERFWPRRGSSAF